jgi:hypothetical protein
VTVRVIMVVRVIIVAVIVIALGATLMPVRMLIHKFAFIHANYL